MTQQIARPLLFVASFLVTYGIAVVIAAWQDPGAVAAPGVSHLFPTNIPYGHVGTIHGTGSRERVCGDVVQSSQNLGGFMTKLELTLGWDSSTAEAPVKDWNLRGAQDGNGIYKLQFEKPYTGANCGHPNLGDGVSWSGDLNPSQLDTIRARTYAIDTSTQTGLDLYANFCPLGSNACYISRLPYTNDSDPSKPHKDYEYATVYFRDIAVCCPPTVTVGSRRVAINHEFGHFLGLGDWGHGCNVPEQQQPDGCDVPSTVMHAPGSDDNWPRDSDRNKVDSLITTAPSPDLP